MTPRDEPVRLLTTEQAVEVAGCTVARFRAWQRLHAGPPAVRLGGAYCYEPDALAAWLRAGQPAVTRFDHPHAAA